MIIMNFVQVIPLIGFCYLCILVHFVAPTQAVEGNEEFCIVETNIGRVRGKLNQTLFEKKPYYSFRGIPFAKAPIGNLRFKVKSAPKSLKLCTNMFFLNIQAPQKIERWNGTLDAFDFGNECVQSPFGQDIFFGFEDCLYLNIYVPMGCSKMNSSKKLSTMAYIYGGQFQFGSSNLYGPDFLMETDVIIV